MRAPVPHPFASLSRRTRRRALALLAGLAVATMLGLAPLDARLRNPESPSGIVSFELAGRREAAARMLGAWGEEGRATAARSLRLDFLFLAAYAPGLALLCAAASDRAGRTGSRLAAPGALLAWGQLAAGAFDTVENLALLRVLDHSAAASVWPRLAALCAWPKFALVAAGLVYVAGAALVALAARIRR